MYNFPRRRLPTLDVTVSSIQSPYLLCLLSATLYHDHHHCPHNVAADQAGLGLLLAGSKLVLLTYFLLVQTSKKPCDHSVCFPGKILLLILNELLGQSSLWFKWAPTGDRKSWAKTETLSIQITPASQANISRRFVVWKWDSYMQVGKYFSIVKYFHCSGNGHLCGKRESVEVNWVIRWNVKITRWKWSGTTAGTSSYYHIITILYLPVRLTPVYTSVCQEWSGGQSPFVWCSVILVAGSLSL